MTNNEKSVLRWLVKKGRSFQEIKQLVDCSDSTIHRYIKVFGAKEGGRA